MQSFVFVIICLHTFCSENCNILENYNNRFFYENYMVCPVPLTVTDFLKIIKVQSDAKKWIPQTLFTPVYIKCCDVKGKLSRAVPLSITRRQSVYIFPSISLQWGVPASVSLPVLTGEPHCFPLNSRTDLQHSPSYETHSVPALWYHQPTLVINTVLRNESTRWGKLRSRSLGPTVASVTVMV